MKPKAAAGSTLEMTFISIANVISAYPTCIMISAYHKQNIKSAEHKTSNALHCLFCTACFMFCCFDVVIMEWETG